MVAAKYYGFVVVVLSKKKNYSRIPIKGYRIVIATTLNRFDKIISPSTIIKGKKCEANLAIVIAVKKIKTAFVFYFAIACFMMEAQTVNVIDKAKLPSILTESSGIEISNRNRIWSHNDSGGHNDLYEFDSTGILLRTLHIQNSINHDWEDLAQDSAGNIYIGDFGNNNNDRTNLAIYKISNPNAVTGSSVASQKISFTYPDQQNFPPADPLLNFDMEAFFWHNHSLYLFSKNRTVPYSGYTKMYRLPDNAGTYTATLVDSFYTGTGPFHLTSITSADISPDGKYVALLSGYHIFLFSNFSGDNFFGGTQRELNFSSLTQKEGIVFINDYEIYLTDEQTDTLGNTGKLYYVNISDFIPTEISASKTEYEFVLFPNPVSSSQFEVRVNDRLIGKELKIVNSCGKLVFESAVLNSAFQIHQVLPAGIYFVEITDKERTLEQKLIVY